MRLFPTIYVIATFALASFALAQAPAEDPHTPGADLARVMIQASDLRGAALPPGQTTVPVPNPLDPNAPPVGYRLRTVGPTGVIVEAWYRDAALTDYAGVTYQATPVPGGVDFQMSMMDVTINWSLREGADGMLRISGSNNMFGVQREFQGTEPDIGQFGERTIRMVITENGVDQVVNITYDSAGNILTGEVIPSAPEHVPFGVVPERFRPRTPGDGFDRSEERHTVGHCQSLCHNE